ncbi:MAG: L,D-transpeptidase family protein [Acidimicrobiales bacterium]
MNFALKAVHRGRAVVVTTAVLAMATLLLGAQPAHAAGAVAVNTATAHGGARDLGPGGSMAVNFPLIDMAVTPSGNGYWLVSSDGGIFSFGDAGFHGSTGSMTLNAPIVGITATPTGRGYWLVASDGGVFSFGDAKFFGSTGDIRLNKAVTGMAATPTGDGYWMVASDGGVFSFGAARFLGSASDIALARPITGIAATRSGKGYWMVGDDGGIFTYGDAPFFGSMAGHDPKGAVIGIAADPRGSGYWIVSAGGYVFPYGAPAAGHAGGQDRSGFAPTVGIAASPAGGYWLVHGQRRQITSGERGPQVFAMQRRLQELGYWIGDLNSRFGEQTVKALWAFQKVEGLPVTGYGDYATMDRLQRTQRPVPRSETGDLIEINKARQVLHIVRGGRTLWTFHISSGNDQPYYYEGKRQTAYTPVGRFSFLWSVNGQDDGPLGSLYRPRYFTRWGIAVHGSPSVPLHPASHGCVRVTNATIDFIWGANLAPMGSEVFVY